MKTKKVRIEFSISDGSSDKNCTSLFYKALFEIEVSNAIRQAEQKIKSGGSNGKITNSVGITIGKWSIS